MFPGPPCSVTAVRAGQRSEANVLRDCYTLCPWLGTCSLMCAERAPVQLEHRQADLGWVCAPQNYKTVQVVTVYKSQETITYCKITKVFILTEIYTFCKDNIWEDKKVQKLTEVRILPFLLTFTIIIIVMCKTAVKYHQGSRQLLWTD